jgi:hypothetical protein
MSDVADVLWGMYQEHCQQGRHHEDQRATMTNLVVAVAGAAFALIALKDAHAAGTPLAAFVTVLGVFGALFSLKHYERFRYHMKCAGEFRDALERLVPATALAELRARARTRHAGKFPIVERIHLFVFWIALNGAVAVLGVVLLVATHRPP